MCGWPSFFSESMRSYLHWPAAALPEKWRGRWTTHFFASSIRTGGTAATSPPSPQHPAPTLARLARNAQEQMRLGDVRDVLRKTRHAGFPVVRETAQVGELVAVGALA